jgi:hypothetical protein
MLASAGTYDPETLCTPPNLIAPRSFVSAGVTAGSIRRVYLVGGSHQPFGGEVLPRTTRSGACLVRT